MDVAAPAPAVPCECARASILKMSIDLRPHAALSRESIARLERALAEFYRRPPAEYYAIADESSGRYSPDRLPFHHHLVQQVSPGMSVLELGCGTAHLCPYVKQRGGRYTGMDYSPGLLEENRRRFPGARFHLIGTPMDETFDLVVSLYAIEHVPDPPAYLDRLWAHCRPGGLIGIICPEFIRCPGLPPSVYYGQTPRRLREKVRTASIVDALQHLIELKIIAPRWKARILAGPPGGFWMNLRPAVLNGGPYTIDADAIHLVGLRDLLWYFRSRGADIVHTSDDHRDLPAEVARYNCYVLARKPQR